MRDMLPNFIYESIQRLQKRYHVTVNFTDVLGVFEDNPAFDGFVAHLTYHDNAFCNYVKLQDDVFKNCLKCKSRIIQKCQSVRSAFYGVCHMGIGEYVFPVLHNEILLAYLCVGEFAEEPELVQRKVAGAKGGQELIRRYQEATQQKDFKQEDDLIYDFQSLSSLMAYAYSIYAIDRADEIYDNPIINKTINFIKSNYNQDITLDTIAGHCYCNRNYLSSLFYKTTQKHLMEYINEVRIHASIRLMRTTNLKISKIAVLCGFNNISYFSTIFKKYNALSPAEYKVNILKQNNESIE